MQVFNLNSLTNTPIPDLSSGELLMEILQL